MYITSVNDKNTLWKSQHLQIYDTCNGPVSKYLELPSLTSLITSPAHAHWFSQYLLDPFPDFFVHNAVNNGICCMSKKEKIPEH